MKEEIIKKIELLSEQNLEILLGFIRQLVQHN